MIEAPFMNQSAATCLSAAKAAEAVRVLNATSDDGWSYQTVPYGGHALILAIDETGSPVGYL